MDMDEDEHSSEEVACENGWRVGRLESVKMKNGN
jgi:hypothetical protein